MVTIVVWLMIFSWIGPDGTPQGELATMSSADACEQMRVDLTAQGYVASPCVESTLSVSLRQR